MINIRLNKLMLIIPPSKKYISIELEFAGRKVSSESLLPCSQPYNEFNLYNETISFPLFPSTTPDSLYISVWLFDQKGSQYRLVRFEIQFSELLDIKSR
jgi:hypothetical protein